MPGGWAEAFGKSLRALVCFLALLLGAHLSFSSTYKVNDRTKIYSEQVAADSVLLKMDNDLSIPVSVKLGINSENLQNGNQATISAVIPARTVGHVVARFKKINMSLSYKLSYSWKIVLGDVTQTPDGSYIYSYPYSKTGTYKISQGPGGAFSHQGVFAYDFLMPVGTPILAARDGIVAMVKSDSKSGGADRKFIDDANYISVYHQDGTLGNYFHLNWNSAIVKEGQFVKKGEIIGYSGNTGFTSGPHLHFEVVRPNLNADKNTFVYFHWADEKANGSLAHLSETANH
jgi:murein DD-endopeptidase MepM/ murein hydrolase activator NlpD